MKLIEKIWLVVAIALGICCIQLLSDCNKTYADALNEFHNKHELQIDEIVYEKKLRSNDYFVLYYNITQKDYISAIFNKDMFGYHLDYLNSGLDNYNLDNSLDYSTEIRVNFIHYKDEWIHYGYIVDDRYNSLLSGDVVMDKCVTHHNNTIYLGHTPVDPYYLKYTIN